MTLDDYIKKLQAAPPEVRALEVYYRDANEEIAKFHEQSDGYDVQEMMHQNRYDTDVANTCSRAYAHRCLRCEAGEPVIKIVVVP